MLRRICDQIATDGYETQPSRGKIRTRVSETGKLCQAFETIEDFVDHAIGGIWVVLGDVIANFVKI